MILIVCAPSIYFGVVDFEENVNIVSCTMPFTIKILSRALHSKRRLLDLHCITEAPITSTIQAYYNT